MPAPAEHKGHAQVCVISTETQMKSSIVKVADTYDYQAVTLSQCARYAVYSSADGIYFYVMDMETHACVQTVCRGTSKANVMSMCLVQIDPANKNSWVLAVTSDRGTTHMFAIDKIQDSASGTHPYQNVTSKLGMMSSLVGGIAAEYSFGQFRLPTQATKPKEAILRGQALYLLELDASDPKYYMSTVAKNDMSQQSNVSILAQQV